MIETNSPHSAETSIEDVRLLDALLNLAHDAIIVRTPESVITDWNAGANELYGWTREEAVGKVTHSFFRTEFPVSLEDILQTLNRQGRWEGELIHTTREGARIVVESRHVLYRDNNGRAIAILEINRDITERKRIEQQLRDSNERLQLAQKAADTGWIEWDIPSGVLAVSMEYRELSGLENGTECITYDRWPAHIYPVDREQVARAMQHAVAAGGEIDLAYRVLAPGKGLRWLTLRARPTKFDGSRPVRYSGLAADETQKRAAIAELALSEERLRLATDTAQMAVCDWDLRTNQVKWSPNLHSLFGVAAEVASSHPDLLLSRVHPTDRDRLRAAILRARQDHISFESEFRMNLQDGSIRWVFGKGDLLTDESGQQVRMIAIVRDITAWKETANKLEKSVREKEIMLKEIHHRVKNNLQVITSILNLQSRSLHDPSIVGIFEETKNRIRSMAAVHNLLSESAELTSLDFGKYIAQLAQNLFASHGVDRGQIQLDLRGVQPVHLEIGQAISCGLIMNELMSNALKHAFPEGRKGELTVTLTDEDSQFRMTLRDDGVGFRPQAISRSSLGLRLVSMLTKQLQGTMDQIDGPGVHHVLVVPYLPSSRLPA